MSKPHRIPRPRHLFPELAAFLIEWKRTNLRAGRTLRKAIGTVPVWVTGSLAGIAGIMLAISLFFVHEPQLQAAASPPPEVPQPVPPRAEFETLPTPAARPNLETRLQLTDFPFLFDESKVVSSSSSAPRAAALSHPFNDGWKTTQLRAVNETPFDSYLSYGARLQSSWPPLLASDVVSTPLAAPTHLALGITVEKSGTLQGAPHEPLTYQIVVRNSSQSQIENLSVRERISSLARVTDVLPEAGVAGDELVWNLDFLAPGASRTFLITLIPEVAGTIETMTRIVPTSRIGALVQVHPAPVPIDAEPVEEILPIDPVELAPEPLTGEPELKLTYTELKPLKQGDTLSMIFAVTNVGTAPAHDVVLFVRLSGQFEHRYGEFVKHSVGTLQPGQSRRALLQATARDPGDGHLDASLTMQGTPKENRELKVPIQAEPPRAGAAQPVVNKPVVDTSRKLTTLVP